MQVPANVHFSVDFALCFFLLILHVGYSHLTPKLQWGLLQFKLPSLLNRRPREEKEE